MSEINLLAIILETIFICNQIHEIVQMLACMDHFCYTTKKFTNIMSLPHKEEQ